MARAEMTFLNRQEEDLIHEQSIQCLAEIGVGVRSQSVLKLLGEKGASVDYDTMIAAIPEQMVEEALEMAPKEFTLCARDPGHDLKLPSRPIPYATTSGLAICVTDYQTGEYRRSTRRTWPSSQSSEMLWTHWIFSGRR
jgi:trimethylamine:corrinoid methyltransferase-like protein